jgi:hypothetical protein
MTLEEIRDEHRSWLRSHGLLDRPWFVLGSAPNPTIPPGITDRAALICINNVGIAASRLGLRPADLTFRNKGKEWKTLAGVKVPLVLWVCDRTPWQILWKRFLIGLRTELGEIRVMARNDRKYVYEHMLGDPDGTSEVGKPSTGIFAVLYGLFAGVPEIILGGMSMDKQGYSHEAKRYRMMHGAEDRFALETIAARYPQVSTTETEVSEATGVPLYRARGSDSREGKRAHASIA